MEYTLECGHLAPTAPDSLGCFPYYKTDPFIMPQDRGPHVYFAGSQQTYSCKTIEHQSGRSVVIISVPSFHSTQTAVMVNLRDLSCQPVTFNGCIANPPSCWKGKLYFYFVVFKYFHVWILLLESTKHLNYIFEFLTVLKSSVAFCLKVCLSVWPAPAPYPAIPHNVFNVEIRRYHKWSLINEWNDFTWKSPKVTSGSENFTNLCGLVMVLSSYQN